MDIDALDEVRLGLEHIEDRPVGQHVEVLTGVLDRIVVELDELARSIPSAR